MSALTELSSAVQQRRSDMGISQTHLAKLSGLSRATVNELENGKINDLSIRRTAQLLGVLGLSLSISAPRPKSRKNEGQSPALDLAARMASVSYRESISAHELRQGLLTGEYPDKFTPHVRTFLDEAAVTMLAGVVEQLHQENGLDRMEAWQRMRDTARVLRTIRAIWQ